MRPEKQQEHCRRSDPRSAMHRQVFAFRPDGRRSVVTVSDMSFSGLQIDGEAFAEDEEIRVLIPHRGQVDARICWASSATAGARFDEDLLLDELVAKREALAIRRARSFNFGSGRVFGKAGCRR